MLISIICPSEVNEGTKKKAFLTCLVSKGFASSMKQTKQKTTSKKTSFSSLDNKAKSAKKKQNACFVFAFLSKKV